MQLDLPLLVQRAGVVQLAGLAYAWLLGFGRLAVLNGGEQPVRLFPYGLPAAYGPPCWSSCRYPTSDGSPCSKESGSLSGRAWRAPSHRESVGRACRAHTGDCANPVESPSDPHSPHSTRHVLVRQCT